jgi:signal-transduction protein with cAMP-binding, CBS, and nucleotidyltransferase domain
MMSTVNEILARKGRKVHTIERGAMVLDAIRRMVEANVGALIVTDGDTICGIFTERDYLRRIVLQGRTSKNTPVVEVTTERLVVVEPSRSVEECMSMMTSERIRHLPVIEEGRLVGLVSIGDVVKHLSRERAAEVRYLTDYIAGKYPG